MSTVPSSNSVALCPWRTRGMAAVTWKALVVGSKISAAASGSPFSPCPPAISTRPSASAVDVWPERGKIIGGAALKPPVTGS